MYKKILMISVALLIMLSCFTMSSFAASQDEYLATATVKSSVNFRADQSASSKIYSLIKTGTVLPVKAANNYWVLVDYNGKTGYVSRSYVTIVEKNPPLSQTDIKINDLIASGKKYFGVPYKYGATADSGYFDCSLFMQTIFKENGITLPRNSRQQSQVGTYVSKSNLKAGDLVFFSTRATVNKTGIDKIGHVGLYLGNGQMIHTYGEGGVKIGSINTDWWSDHYITARRIVK